MAGLELLPGTFVCSMGYLRSGKSMNTTRIAAFGKRVLGMRVVSNFTLSFADYRVTSLEELRDEKIVSGCILCLDEMQTILDSRGFGDKEQMDLSRWLIWLGKLKVVLLYTTPHFGMVDVRLRQLTQWLYMCRSTTMRGARHTIASLYSYSGIGDELEPISKSVFRHSDYYNAYDTLDRNTSLGRYNTPNTPAPTEAVGRGRGASVPSSSSVPRSSSRVVPDASDFS